jgi:hypothetical protein
MIDSSGLDSELSIIGLKCLARREIFTLTDRWREALVVMTCFGVCQNIASVETCVESNDSLTKFTQELSLLAVVGARHSIINAPR